MSKRGGLRSAVIGVTLFAVVGCSSNSTSDPGNELFRSSGCAACHGTSGQGGIAPALTDLYGSTIEVTNADGDTIEVVADGDYLRRSITDPDAERVPGFASKMPVANLSADEVEQLVAYIESLSSVPPDVSLPTTVEE